MDEPQKLSQIDRLMSAFSLAGARASDPEQTLRNYLLAVECWELIDVTAAVDALIAGNAPNVHKGFLPTSAELGGECRRQSGLRLDSARRDRDRRPAALPEPTGDRTPESCARVREMAEKFAEEHGRANDNDLYWKHDPLPLPWAERKKGGKK